MGQDGTLDECTPLGIRTSRSHVLLTAGIVGLVLLTAVVVALARIIGGIEATPGPWSIILVIAAAFAGFVVWRISDPVVVREDRLAYRRFAIGLGVAAVAVAPGRHRGRHDADRRGRES